MKLSSLIGKLVAKKGPFPAEDWDHLRFSFSQFGEDLAVLSHFDKRRGFYVDIGAHHPVRFSNTYLLHQKGWTGINVDANPNALEAFRMRRPRDINLHAALSDQVQQVEFSLYDESALCRIELKEGDPGSEGNAGLPAPIKKIALTTTTLTELLSKHLPPDQKVDFLNVDCEGHDVQVLRSNDWKRFRPELVSVEDWENGSQTTIDTLLQSQGYELAFLRKPAKLYFRKE